VVDNNNDDENTSEKNETGEEIESDTKKEDASAGLQAHIEKLQNDMLYLKADFENYKKRMLKERSDILKYGCENLIVSFLDVLDNFERAMSMEITSENLKSFSDGIHMIANEFKNVLGRFGVTEVKALGENFDPSHHEAMGTEPTDDYKPGTISKVFTKPFKLHDRLIRPGKVVIAQEPKKETED
jgi:molecular chaperone GrpE